MNISSFESAFQIQEQLFQNLLIDMNLTLDKVQKAFENAKRDYLEKVADLTESMPGLQFIKDSFNSLQNIYNEIKEFKNNLNENSIFFTRIKFANESTLWHLYPR